MRISDLRLNSVLAATTAVERGILFAGLPGAPDPPMDSEAWEQAAPGLIAKGLATASLQVFANHDLSLPALRRALRNAARSEFAITTSLEAAAGEVFRLLASSGVHAILIKGPALAAAVPALRFRFFSDLDLLVSAGAFSRATDALLGAGFEPAQSNWEPRVGHTDRFSHAVTFVRGSVAVDLHRCLPPPVFGLRVPFDDMKQQSTDLLVSGSSVPVLAPAHTLVATALHAVSSLRNNQLGPWRDIAYLLHTFEDAHIAFATYNLTSVYEFVSRQLEACGLRLVHSTVKSRHSPIDRARLRALARGRAHHRELTLLCLPWRWVAPYFWGYVVPERAQLVGRFGTVGRFPTVAWWAFSLRRRTRGTISD